MHISNPQHSLALDKQDYIVFQQTINKTVEVKENFSLDKA